MNQVLDSVRCVIGYDVTHHKQEASKVTSPLLRFLETVSRFSRCEKRQNRNELVQIRAETVHLSSSTDRSLILRLIRILRTSVDHVEETLLTTFFEGEENSCPRAIDMEEERRVMSSCDT